MRAIRKYFFPLLLSLTIFLSTGISTYAMGDGNIDGGGGSFGTGSELKYSLQGTTQGRYLTGGVPPVRFSM